jgi:sigma-B regulation protein RsbU (phosphoserine phosphatase)
LRLLVLTTDPELASAATSSAESTDVDVLVCEGLARIGETGIEPESIDGVLVDARLGRAVVRSAIEEFPAAVVAIPGQSAQEVLEFVQLGARDVIFVPALPEAVEATILRWARKFGPSIGRLEWIDDDGRRHHTPISTRAEIRVGRELDNDIAFASQIVSRHHARIVAEASGDGHRLILRDEESRHGVFVNGHRVRREVVLVNGDTVRFGKIGAPAVTVHVEDAKVSDLSASTQTLPMEERGIDGELKDIASLLDTFLRVNDSLVLEEIVSLVLTRSMDFAGAERGLILLAPEVIEGQAIERTSTAANGQFSESLVPALALGRDGRPLPEGALSISRRIPEEVFQTGSGKIVQDLLESSSASDHLLTIDLGVRSAMCVPLRARLPGADKDTRPVPIGVLYVDSGSKGRVFSDRALHALESLANEAAQAIVNAKLYAESRAKRQIDEELRIAQAIQANLLPPRRFESDAIEVAGDSTPCRAVGGDIFNYYSPSDDRTCILVGDVSGKGVSAAIFSAMLDGHFLGLSSLSRPREDLPGQLQNLNLYLIEKSQGHKFVSFFFGLLEEGGRLVHVNAGHPWPFLVRANGTVEQLSTGGKIMGLLEDASYEIGDTAVSPGDVLIVYSDGLTDARNPAGDFFGKDRLEAAIRGLAKRSAAAIHDGIREAVARFTDGRALSDDLTLLVVRIRGSTPVSRPHETTPAR